MKKTVKDVPKKLNTDNPAFVKPFLRPSKEKDLGVRELKHGGKVKAMYGAKMKKAMYGAKMKKK